jgi:hypothetical protein
MSEFGRNFDSSALRYEQWVEFFFDRPVPPPTDDVGKRFFDDDLREEYTFFDASDPARVVSYMTRLFGDFPNALAGFTLPQINQGIWVMFGCNFECQRYLFDSSVPLAARLECIRSMHCVYADFVAPSNAGEMENCFYMWWDLIAGSFWSKFCEYPVSKSFDETSAECFFKKDLKNLDEEAWQIFDTMFETLLKVLALNDDRAQTYALHGLGHLSHPKVKEVVQSYIDAHVTEFDEKDLRWVEQCRDGVVL